MEINEIIDVESKIGYCFKDKSLLTQAFTRSDVANELNIESSETLEYYGDSILNYVLVLAISNKYTFVDANGFHCKFNEGELTNIVSRYTCKDYLSERIRRLEIGKYIHSRASSKLLSLQEDLFESLVCAIFLDCNKNLDITSSIVLKMLDIDINNLDSRPDDSSFIKMFCDKKKLEVVLEITNTDENQVGGILYIPSTDYKAASSAESKYLLKKKLCSILRKQIEERSDYLKITFEDNLLSSINSLDNLWQKKIIPQPDYIYRFNYETNLWEVTIEIENINTIFTGFGRYKTDAKKEAAQSCYDFIKRNYYADGFNPMDYILFYSIEDNKLYQYAFENYLEGCCVLRKFPDNSVLKKDYNSCFQDFEFTIKDCIEAYAKSFGEDVYINFSYKTSFLPENDDLSVGNDYYNSIIEEIYAYANK